MDDSVITSTQADLPDVCKGCSKLQSRLERALRQLERQLSFGEEVRVENEKLKQQLQDLKQRKQRKNSEHVSSGTQTEATANYHLHPAYRNGLDSGDPQPVKGDPELEAAATRVGEEQSVADMLRDAANECLNDTGYVYDEKSGLYYDYGSGYYYDPHRKLFYEPRSGTYYSYDEDAREYHFHSREDPERLKRHCEQLLIQTGGQHAPPKRKAQRTNPGRAKPSEQAEMDCARSPVRADEPEADDDMEEGEISSDVDEADETNAYEMQETEVAPEEGEMGIVGEEEALFDSAPEYPPCVRLMITSSGNLNVGTLFIVTCAGGTIGRKSNRYQHAVALNDEALPECACQISYDPSTGTYLLEARAKGGRVALNGQLLRKKERVARILHGDKLSVGGTVLGVHIHPGAETCDGCEPGVAQAALQEKSEPEEVSTTSLEEQRRRQMKQLKSKFGLRGAAFETHRVRGRDRAAERRVEKGSDSGATSGGDGTSAHRHLPDSNKGAQMLAKMGWKHGQSLGKSGSDGIVEPVTAEIRFDPQAGLGSDLPSVSLDAGSNPGQVTRFKNWKKMKERYEQLEKVPPHLVDDSGT